MKIGIMLLNMFLVAKVWCAAFSTPVLSINLDFDLIRMKGGLGGRWIFANRQLNDDDVVRIVFE